MNLYVLVVALATLVGLLAYVLSSNKKVETLGLIALCAGVLFFVLRLAGGRL